MSFSHIWEIIIKTNTLNFIVFFGLILLILKKIKLSKKISNLQENIQNEVEASDKEKENSQKALEKAQFDIEQVPKVVEKIINSARTTADKMSENIVSAGQNQVTIIENNAKRAIENDLKKTEKKLADISAIKAIAAAENNLIRSLEQNPSLNEIFIDEAIDKLEAVEI